MTAWATLRRLGTGAALPALLLVVAPLPAADEAVRPAADEKPAKPAKPTPAQLRATAEAAEKAGDWEAAFAAYCHLFVADRTAPDVREKLNTALRRSQQLRRHRDRQFQEYVSPPPLPTALVPFAKVSTRFPCLSSIRSRPHH